MPSLAYLDSFYESKNQNYPAGKREKERSQTREEKGAYLLRRRWV